MLRVELDSLAIAKTQQIYLARDTALSRDIAKSIIGLRMAFDHAARSFDRAQVRARFSDSHVVADGMRETLADLVHGPYAKWPWPSSRTSILQGLKLQTAIPMPAKPRRPGGATIREIDSHSYIVRLDDGPTQSREYGDLTALAVYLHPLRILRIFWIGREIDFPDAVKALDHATKGFTDWSATVPEYDIWLRNQS